MIVFANNYGSFIIYSILQPKNIFFEPYPKHDKASLNSCNVDQVGGCLSLTIYNHVPNVPNYS